MDIATIVIIGTAWVGVMAVFLALFYAYGEDVDSHQPPRDELRHR